MKACALVDSTKNKNLRRTPLHREHLTFLPVKGWSSDFPPLPSAFSSNCSMAFMLRSHNGVHCCGTVGDSHSSSQLIAAKRTFQGSVTYDIAGAKLQLFLKTKHYFRKKFVYLHPIW